jgi:hypothetical protein
MKPDSIPLYKDKKENIIKKYPALAGAIDRLEQKIIENPNGGIKETIILNNCPIITRKRGMKTDLFTDRLPDHYLYLTINYGLTDKGVIVFLAVYLHDYIV